MIRLRSVKSNPYRSGRVTLDLAVLASSTIRRSRYPGLTKMWHPAKGEQCASHVDIEAPVVSATEAIYPFRSTGLAPQPPELKPEAQAAFQSFTEKALCGKCVPFCMMGHIGPRPRLTSARGRDMVRGSDDPAALMKLSQTGTRRLPCIVPKLRQ